MLNVYKIEEDNSIYGPGKRTVIWFRGCSIRCAGCINPELWERDDKSNVLIDSLLSNISNDGVTLLGGEPLDQENIERFIDKLKTLDKSIIIFTGYSLNNIDDNKKRIASKCDVVISEPFIKSLKDDSLYLRGSTNQIITINSTKFSKEDFDKPNTFEIKIQNDNLTSFGRNKKIISDILELN